MSMPLNFSKFSMVFVMMSVVGFEMWGLGDLEMLWCARQPTV